MMSSTTHLIAAREDFRVRNIVAQYGMNIVHYSWVMNCLERCCLVELEPMFMVSANRHLEAYFLRSLDQFGDHNTQPVEPGRLRDILDKVDDSAVD